MKTEEFQVFDGLRGFFGAGLAGASPEAATGAGLGLAGAFGLGAAAGLEAAGLAAGLASGTALATGLAGPLAGALALSTSGSLGLLDLRAVLLSGARASASASLRAISQWRASWPEGLPSDSQI